MRKKGRVEAPHAGEAAAEGDQRHGQVGVGQQLFGGQQAPGLQVLQRRDAEMRFEDAPQMPVADAHAGRQRFHRRGVVGPGFGLVQQPGGLVGEDG